MGSVGGGGGCGCGGGGGIAHAAFSGPGGVCRRPTWRQLEVAACCWPFSVGGAYPADGYQRGYPQERCLRGRGRPGGSYVCSMFACFWVGAARVGRGLLGLGRSALPCWMWPSDTPGPARSHDPKEGTLQKNTTEMAKVPEVLLDYAQRESEFIIKSAAL